MVAIFTYGLKMSKENFQENEVELHTLCNYNELVKKAIEISYIGHKESKTLKKWKDDPENWG
tara:strand:+ start:179 stop:364 length:186 start_codon:yes stop_codon:yes gene_type:complete